MQDYKNNKNYSENDIAVIAMSVRLPGANSINAFWENLCEGKESITFFNAEELREVGVSESDLQNPNYVKANAVLDGIEYFDAKLFGYSPREAEIIDPQHRLFLTCSSEALDSAGYHSNNYSGRIGVFAGAGFNTYLFNLFSNPAAINSLGYFQTMMMNGSDHLTSMVSYKLNLTGPAITIQTACSTSLVAVHLACQSLLEGDSDMVLAGGSSLTFPQKIGYMYQEGGINSPDGHCRAFDAEAQGTINASGVGVVLLKRLSDAMEDKDTIYSVIKGSAINNDGSQKIGYTAPSVVKQAEVILEAIEISGVDPEEITFIEAHGTGTPLGDPIEVEALNKAFRQKTDKLNFCAIGSVKTNIGHTDTAAGVVGLIKASLSLYKRKLPKSLHYKTPNPKINFADSPFFVNTTLLDLSKNTNPLKAGISSFGLGGTNAHVILTEPPQLKSIKANDSRHILAFSAENQESLEMLSKKYIEFFASNSEQNLVNIAFSMQNSQKDLRYRRFTIAENTQEAEKLFEKLNPQKVFTSVQNATTRPVAFLFPGLGTQYRNMGQELLRSNKFFKEFYTQTLNLFRDLNSSSLTDYLDEKDLTDEKVSEILAQPKILLPSIFCLEYALAKTLGVYGITPQFMLGHSFGEYAAACLAGVFSLEKAAKLVLFRADLLETIEDGAMLSVATGEDHIKSLLNDDVSLALINAKNLVTLAGSVEAIDDFQKELLNIKIESRKIFVNVAMHSPAVDLIMQPLEEFVAKLSPQKPQIPYISCITGKFIEPEEATNPSYWSGHLRNTVRFYDALTTLFANKEIIPLEVGPGTSISNLARQHPNRHSGQIPLSLMKHPVDKSHDEQVFLQTLGRLWLSGVKVDFKTQYDDEECSRITLPSYPYNEQKYWIEPSTHSTFSAEEIDSNKELPPEKQFHISSWKQASPLSLPNFNEDYIAENVWMILGDNSDLCNQITERLINVGLTVISVSVGETFSQVSEKEYILDIGNFNSYELLIKTLFNQEMIPNRIIHLWDLDEKSISEINLSTIELAEQFSKGYLSLLFLFDALGIPGIEKNIRLLIIDNHLNKLPGETNKNPIKPIIAKAISIIEHKYLNAYCRTLDINSLAKGNVSNNLISKIIAEADSSGEHNNVILRKSKRYINYFTNLELNTSVDPKNMFKDKGIYLIIGKANLTTKSIAGFISKQYNSKIIFIEPNLPVPEKNSNKMSGKSKNKNNGNVFELSLKTNIFDKSLLTDSITEVEEIFGTINGVIFITQPNSIIGKGISGKTLKELKSSFEKIILGTFNIVTIFSKKDVDFFTSVSLNSEASLQPEKYADAAGDKIIQTLVRQKLTDVLSVDFSAVLTDLQISNLEDENPPASRDLESIGSKIVKSLQILVENDITGNIEVSTIDLNIKKRVLLNKDIKDKENLRKNAGANHSRPELTEEYIPPSGELEELIAEIWQDLLGISKVGRNDNFFDLGGHSLIAPQFAVKMQEVLDLQIPIESIFQQATISEMGSFIEKLVLTDSE